MDPVTLGMAKADARKLATFTRRDNLFKGLPVVATRSAGHRPSSGDLTNGTVTSGTYRYCHIVTTSSYDLRIVYGNYNYQNTVPNAITVKGSVEFPSAAAVSSGSANGSHQLTFNGGASSVVIQPGAWVVSDPISFDVTPGQFLYTRTYVSVNSTEKWPLAMSCTADVFMGSTVGTPGTDVTGGGVVTHGGVNGGTGYGPVAVIGTPASLATPTVIGITGDSIAFGSGDVAHGDLGFLVRAVMTANKAWLSVAIPGDRIANLISATSPGTTRQKMPLLSCVSVVLDEYGTNDVTNGDALLTIQNNRIEYWRRLSKRGALVYATTIPPNNTSTDGWATTTNQTVKASEAVRTGLNDWLRVGAPVLASTLAVSTVGTTGAVVAGQTGHPLKGYYEVADSVESARNSGKWRVDLTRTVTTGAITSGAATLTSSTASFTSADLWRGVAVAGAGAAGAVLVTTIIGVTNSTTVTVNTNAGTTVSAASTTIGVLSTDGTHPSTEGHILMAAAVPL